MSQESVTTCVNVSGMEDYQDMSNMTFSLVFRTPFTEMFYKYMFIVMYCAIFIVCIVGNTIVLIVTAKSVRMNSRTNFFLGNLAAADLCVGILCILPNLQTFIYFGWFLGTAMCKVYYFAENFSKCVSVLLLAVIAVERYIAVMQPLRAKGLFTNCRMHVAQVSIWVFSAVYNVPKMAIFDTIQHSDETEGVPVCIIRDDVINLRLYFTINFVLWYALPLVTMSVAYTIISWTLWHSGTIFNKQKNGDVNNYCSGTKMLPLVRDSRSSCNASSSSSGGTGSIGECSQRNSGGSVECDHTRHGKCNTGCISYDVSSRYYSNYCAESHDRYLLGTQDCSCRCTTVTTTRFIGSRSDNLTPSQPLQPMHEYGTPVYWSWPSREDTARDDDGRSLRHSFGSRISVNHSNKNTALETACLTPTCLHHQKTHTKRLNNIQQTTPSINSKQRPNRRSFHSDCASDSSAGNTPTYNMNVRRYQPAMSQRVLSSRRKVVRLLVLVLLTFALCVLPHHVRLLMFYWNIYPQNSFGVSFFPPLAFMSLYLNSALNPVIYGLFSESFRRSFRECFRRHWHRTKSCLSMYVALCFRRHKDSHHKSSEIRMG